MTEKHVEHPSDATRHTAGAGQPIPEYLLRSLPEVRVLPDWVAYLVWREVSGRRTQRS